MNLLLDTHIVLWWLADDPRLPKIAHGLMVDSGNTLHVSVASLWEIAVKNGKGKLQANPDEVLYEIEAEGFVILPILARHVTSLATLAPHHADPFDRIMVAQATAESMQLLSHDGVLSRYGDAVMWV